MNQELSEAEHDLVKRVQRAFDSAESQHKQFKEKAEAFYARYRNYQAWRDSRLSSDENDRDTFWNDAAREWGAKLSIPYGFSTIETIVPRMLSQSPRILVLPRDRESTKNVQNMKSLVDLQQDEIDFELKLQDVAKDGLMYGLGVLKSFWREETRRKKKIVANPIPIRGQVNGQPVPEYVQVEAPEVVFSGNDAEAVSVFDFFWDPFGYDMRTVGWVIHRLWMSHEDVLKKLSDPKHPWNYECDEEELKSLASSDKFDESWSGRNTAAGYNSGDDQKGNVHEVWEFHDREQVITILDRRIPVQQGENPYWHGELPFQIFRPTRLNKEFVGISELEPLQDLLDEMDTLRSQRRDNATLVLQKTMAYQHGLVDPADLKMGPGVAIPVEGDPRELLHEIRVGDIPNSSYQEEASLQGNIEMTSGISEAISGGDGSSGGAAATATGAQLVSAAASMRIQNKTKLLEKETIRGAARQWVANNQQHIVSNQEVPIPQAPEPGKSTPAWTWLEIGPNELAGRFSVNPEGGATAPDNVPQKRQDAQLVAQLTLNNPNVDQQRAWEYVLRNLDVDHPESWVSSGQQIPSMVLEILAKQGVPEELLAQAVQAADQIQQGGDPTQALQAPQEPSQNGSGAPQSSNGSNGSSAGQSTRPPEKAK